MADQNDAGYDDSCSNLHDIMEFFFEHKLRLRYHEQDDRGNKYLREVPLPEVGKAMSIYVRETTTIDEDFHYLFGYAFIDLVMGLDQAPGIKKELSVAHIETNHS